MICQEFPCENCGQMTALGLLCAKCETYCKYTSIYDEDTSKMTNKQKMVLDALKRSELQTDTQIIKKINYKLTYRGLRVVLMNLVKLGYAEHSDCLGPDTWCIPE